MPLKLYIAIFRKIGEPKYGSRGATVGLEMEVDSSLVNQPQQLHERVARLFHLAKESVDRELGGHHQNGSASGPSPVRSVTPAQLRAIHAIASRQNLGWPRLSGRFSCRPALSSLPSTPNCSAGQNCNTRTQAQWSLPISNQCGWAA